MTFANDGSFMQQFLAKKSVNDMKSSNASVLNTNNNNENTTTPAVNNNNELPNPAPVSSSTATTTTNEIQNTTSNVNFPSTQPAPIDNNNINNNNNNNNTNGENLPWMPPAYAGWSGLYPSQNGTYTANAQAVVSPFSSVIPPPSSAHIAQSSLQQQSNSMGNGGGNGMGDRQPSRSIWVGNLHPMTSEADLQAEFQMFGMIERVKILQEKNCAFVHFVDTSAATAAYRSSRVRVIHGVETKIGWGKPDPALNPAAASAQVDQNARRNLWVGNIGHLTEDDLKNLFGKFGSIENVKILNQKKCAFVDFVNLEDARKAKLELQGATIKGATLRVNYGKVIKIKIKKRRRKEMLKEMMRKRFL